LTSTVGETEGACDEEATVARKTRTGQPESW
jgi:hypothetical protein